MNSILDKICNDKRKEVEIQRKLIPEKELYLKIKNIEKTRGFKRKIEKNFLQNNISVIAEIKKASPSKGIISKNFNPAEIARQYSLGKATCISVLTDKKYFHGSNNDLIAVKKNSVVPILRKDFIVSEYQILESRAIGADCILLINSILDFKKINNYIKIANQLGMDVLLETHDINELSRWIKNDKILLGINNRNLKNMKVNIEHSVKIFKELKPTTNIICESGISSIKDVNYLINNNFKTFLIGEYLMKSKSPNKLLYSIIKKGTK